MKLRTAQKKILTYQRGLMAVSAVPGSGKTFTLTELATRLIHSGRVNPAAGQQVLVVTYLNASVDTFKARIHQRLRELEREPVGFDVRTLHSLGLEIVKTARSGLTNEENELTVLSQSQSASFLAQAVDSWVEQNGEVWHSFLPVNTPQEERMLRSTVEETAVRFISTAKNSQYRPEQIQQQLYAWQQQPPDLPLAAATGRSPLLQMMSGIYGRYQTILTRQAAYDFDDLIWEAARLLAERPDLVQMFSQRWPYILEDEAQDSVPLQEVLLTRLTGGNGNLVRVGDPNQAVTSSYTSADPGYFQAFLERPDVQKRPLPNSGRSALCIIHAANRLLHWVCDEHPVPEVRERTFYRQDILPTPPGDSQPNPDDSLASIQIRLHGSRETEEVPKTALWAAEYARKYPTQTLAILVPTHKMGHEIAVFLDSHKAKYDNLLRGGTREREIAAVLYALLGLLAQPQQNRLLLAAHTALQELGHLPAGLPLPEEQFAHIQTVLRSISRPEAFLFPADEAEFEASLPGSVLSGLDWEHLTRFAGFLTRLFGLRSLPIDDLALALGDELFARHELPESDLSIAYHIAGVLRQWRDVEPGWRLPELAAQLADVAAGRRDLPNASPRDAGYEPQPGRITLSTQHSAKGLEWDAVFLVGIDGRWIPNDLDSSFQGERRAFGGNPAAEARAQLNYLMTGSSALYPGRTATESANIDIICERLRLLYVGISRARSFLLISRSRRNMTYQQTSEERPPATALGVVARYLKELNAGGEEKDDSS